MNWQFWRPKNTVSDVANRVAVGLRTGTILLNEPLDEELSDDEIEPSVIVMHLDLPQEMSDAAILDIVKDCAIHADEENRRGGGNGLRIGRVFIDLPKVKLALWPNGSTLQSNPH